MQTLAQFVWLINTTKFHSTWFKARFAETLKFTARNQVRKSHVVLRQTGFETPLPGQWRRSQSGAQSKKPRVVLGLRLPQGRLSRFEVFVLAGARGCESFVRFEFVKSYKSLEQFSMYVS